MTRADSLAGCWLLRSEDERHGLPLQNTLLVRLDTAAITPSTIGGSQGVVLASRPPLPTLNVTIAWWDRLEADSLHLELGHEGGLLWRLRFDGDSLSGVAYHFDDRYQTTTRLGAAIGLRHSCTAGRL